MRIALLVMMLVALSPLARAEETPSSPPRLTLAESLRQEKPTTLARAEVIAGQAVNGLFLGTMLCVTAADCGPKGGVLLAMVGTGGGALLTSQLTANGITAGHSLAINSGSLWGIAAGLSLSEIMGVEGNATTGVVAASDMVGTLVGHLLWTEGQTGAGDVSLVNSGGIWATALTGLLLAAISPSDLDPRAFTAIISGGAVAGMLGGYALSRNVPMSRSRVLMLDLGAAAGLLFAGGIAVLAEVSDGQAASILGATGIVGGMATAGYLTQDWDGDVPPVSVGFAPTQGGAMLTLTASR